MPMPMLDRIGPTGAGILIMLLATAIFAGSDATAKLIGPSIPLLAMLWLRYLYQAVVLGVWLVRRGVSQVRFAGPMRLQVLRALLLLTNSAATFAGLRYLPLPVSTALVMMAPLFTTLLAVMLLGERVPLPQWLMVVLGFAGMLMIVRPGGDAFSWAVGFPIAAALSFACLQVVSSRLSKGGDAMSTNFLTAAVATVALSALVFASKATLLPQMAQVSASSWLLLIAMATLATFGQVAMLSALGRAPLSTLTPFGYAQLAFATLLGWVLFGNTPDAVTTYGIAVIAGSGIGTVLLRFRANHA